MQLVVVSAVNAAISMAKSTSTAFFLMIYHTFSRKLSKILIVSDLTNSPPPRRRGKGW
jgi:hypothetical protein